MTSWEAIILGIVQGLTEFLPVSSSGHLELGQYFLGFQDIKNYILFDLVCHLGTLGAIFLIFWQQIKESFSTRSTRFWQVILGTLPLFPLVFILKPIKEIFDKPQYLGYCFLLTAFLLWLGMKYSPKMPALAKNRWKDPIVIGFFQAVAVLPGVSRSGSTISAARILGWDKQNAMTFSFLLAIPAILGGITLETYSLFFSSKAPEQAAISASAFILGFATSFAVGFASLKMLIYLTIQNKWNYFVWYCLVLGALTTFYFNV